MLHVLCHLKSYLKLKSQSSIQKGYQLLVIYLIVIMTIQDLSYACGPGRGGGRRRSPRKLTPLVFKQHVPNVSENTIAASGLNKGKINKTDPRFKELVPNYNHDIVFKDEEGTGADRLMSQRLKEKLNTLAISVMNQWPGVKLRVTEGWDEEGHHAPDSLHYEGRAVDITTSDKDRSKYGMLARLAVEAGFDWVYYESRFHIHVSVKSDKADAHRSGGCFSGDSIVYTQNGPVTMSNLNIGDEILTVGQDGHLVYSEIILFLDRDPRVTRVYYHIETESGKVITVTETHLVFVTYSKNSSFGDSNSHAIFASKIELGMYILIRQESKLNETIKEEKLVSEKVVRITTSKKQGAFAPLTKEGNLIVDQVVASCYALIADQSLAHLAFLPIRIWSNFIDSLKIIKKLIHLESSKLSKSQTSMQYGIHWYPKLLYSLSDYILSNDLMYS